MNRTEWNLNTSAPWVEAGNVTNVSVTTQYDSEGPVFSRSRYTYARIMDPITYSLTHSLTRAEVAADEHLRLTTAVRATHSTPENVEFRPAVSESSRKIRRSN